VDEAVEREWAEPTEVHPRWHRRWAQQGLRQEPIKTSAPATETADTVAASLSVFQSVDKRVAEAMRKKWPHGIPPKGMGWKEANRILEPYGGVRSKPTYYRAIDINRALLAARQSQP
jgi:hypothetical protein